MKPKRNKNLNSNFKICQVCQTQFAADLSKPCDHICVPCELIFSDCPVCIAKEEELRELNSEFQSRHISACSSDISAEKISEVANRILTRNMQNAPGSTGPPFGQQEKEKMSFQAQIARTCFLGVWDTVFRSVMGALGLKSKSNSLIGRSANTVLLRVGRQAGRKIFPDLCQGIRPPPVSSPASSTVKIIGGLAAFLICVQVISRNSQ